MTNTRALRQACRMSGFADLINTVAAHQKIAARDAAVRDQMVTDVPALLEAIKGQVEARELSRATVTCLQLACVLARRAGWEMSKAGKEVMGMWGRTSFIEADAPETLAESDR